MRLSRSFLGSLAAVVVTAQNNLTTTQSIACAQLASALPGKVFLPDAPTYNASITSYPFIQLRLHPTCILRPTCAQDVSVALGVLQRNNNTRFAVKGGGHNANAGFNNVENGVTIDMQSMKDVEVERGNQVIRIGAGALSQDAYEGAEKQNLTVMAGRIGVVGLGGFLTGGGVAFFSGQYGWSCDSVVNFEVALASGAIINANATSNSDLFAALKGGQNNFGIVTRFDVKAYPNTNVWGGRIVYGPTAGKDLLTAYTNYKTPQGFDPYVAGWVTIHYNHSITTFSPIAIMWYTKPDQKPGGMKDIVNVQPQVSYAMTEGPISAQTRNDSRQVVANPRRTIWATTTFRVNPTIIHKVDALFRAVIPSICESYADSNPTAELTFQTLPGPPGKGSPPNSFGFKEGEKPQIDTVFLQVELYFDGAEATEGLYKGLNDMIEAVDELTKAEGVYHPFKYLNFAAWFQDPLASYGAAEKQKLKAVARKYDPNQVFQRQVWGGFKLF